MVYLREESHVTILSDFALVEMRGGEYAIIDIEDAERVAQHEWMIHHLKGESRYVKMATAPYTRLHRFIKGHYMTDHKNGDTMDNRRSNLRRCTHTENMRNRRTLRYKQCESRGVSKTKGRFTARIMADKDAVFIGAYDTEGEASEAYQKKAKELFGEFAPQF